MKAIASPLCAAVILLSAVAVHAQQYAIDWFTIDGGGGSSAGGPYAVSGTIGQADAGRLAGGSYVVEGGFWGIVAAIQTPGAPILRVQRLGSSVRVFWNASAGEGYILDETPALGAGWLQVSSALQTNSNEISLTIPVPINSKYYRLRKP